MRSRAAPDLKTPALLSLWANDPEEAGLHLAKEDDTLGKERVWPRSFMAVQAVVAACLLTAGPGRMGRSDP